MFERNKKGARLLDYLFFVSPQINAKEPKLEEVSKLAKQYPDEGTEASPS